MPLSTDKMREYQKERRAKLSGRPVVKSKIENVSRETMPDLASRIEALEKRVTLLENRVTKVEVVKVVDQVTKRQPTKVSTPADCSDDAKSLYARVIAQKEARIRGTC